MVEESAWIPLKNARDDRDGRIFTRKSGIVEMKAQNERNFSGTNASTERILSEIKIPEMSGIWQEQKM